MKAMFTPEELAEMAAFDAEVDDEPLSVQDYRESAERDKDAILSEMSADQRRKARKIAANQRKYYEENKEQIAAYQRKYYEENKEQIAAYQRKYYEENKEQIAAYQRKYYEDPDQREKRRIYNREYARKRRAKQKGA